MPIGISNEFEQRYFQNFHLSHHSVESNRKEFFHSELNLEELHSGTGLTVCVFQGERERKENVPTKFLLKNAKIQAQIEQSKNKTRKKVLTRSYSISPRSNTHISSQRKNKKKRVFVIYIHKQCVKAKKSLMPI